MKLLPALCVGALMVLGSILIPPAISDGNTNATTPNAPTGVGLSSFVAQGGSTATACDGITTCTTGAITNVGAGDTLVVVVTEYTTSAGAPSLVEEVTSGGDTDLTLLGVTPCIAGSGHGVTAIYGLADVTAQSSVTFTVDYPAAEYYTIHALDVQGAAASPFEAAGTGVCSSAAGTMATASVTTTVADDLVILGVEVRASTTISASGGDTLVTQASTTGAELDSGAMLDEIDPTTGPISLSATFTSASWTALAVALKTAPLVSGTVSPSAAAIDAGQTIGLTTTAATGGTPPITYQWYAATSTTTCSSGTLISGATGQAYTTPALSVGTYDYCVWATDSSTPTNLVVQSNVAVITVNAALTAPTISISPTTPIDSGQSATLSTTTSFIGGTSPYTCQWLEEAPGGSYTDLGSSFSCSVGDLPTSSTGVLATTGTWSFELQVMDSSGAGAVTTTSNAVTVTVNAALTVTITPASSSIDNGQTVTLTAHPSGGTGPDTYAWYSGAACSGTVLATTQVYTTPALTATTTYCVAVTDSAYSPVTATATSTVTVSASPLTVTITPSAPSIDAEQTIQLTAHPSGGTGADSYAWYSGATCSGSVLATTQVYTTPTLTATAKYCVAVTDSAYLPDTANATATVTVSASPLTVTITPSAPTINSGQTIQLTAHPSGGTGADSYAWYSGATCSGSVLATTQVYTTSALTAITTYCVVVTDSSAVPARASANATVTVNPSSPTSGSGAAPPPFVYPVIGALAAALVAALLLALLRRGRKRVTFTETGLPAETEWSLTLKGATMSSRSSSISFNAPKGTHEYAVKEIPGYAVSPSTGTVTVDRNPVEVRVTFRTLPP